MTKQNEIEKEERSELEIDWEEKRRQGTFNVSQGENRLVIFRETYRGMPYEIHVIYHKELEKYKGYDHGMWATLERPSEMIELYDAIDSFLRNAGIRLRDEEFCYADTAHGWNEGQDINQRIQEMRREAHYEIDLFYEYLSKAGNALDGIRRIINSFKENSE